MTDTVLTYKGRPVTDLTKDELVDAMTWAFQEIEYQRERADRLLNAASTLRTLADTKAEVVIYDCFCRTIVDVDEIYAIANELETHKPNHLVTS